MTCGLGTTRRRWSAGKCRLRGIGWVGGGGLPGRQAAKNESDGSGEGKRGGGGGAGSGIQAGGGVRAGRNSVAVVGGKVEAVGREAGREEAVCLTDRRDKKRTWREW